MWQEVNRVTPKISVLRRLLFAIASVPEGTPNRWEIVCQFSFEKSKERASVEDVKLLAENIEFLDAQAFSTDSTLAKELISADGVKKGYPIGIIMISSNSVCKECGSALVIRGDRSSSIVLYTESMGTVPATHYIKHCVNARKGCWFSQHYGYHTKGESNKCYYDRDWDKLPYFESTGKTAFDMSILRRLDAEILIGQLSYLQSSNIYNDIHQYQSCETQQDGTVPLSTYASTDDVHLRARLDYRRLEEAHLKFAILNVYRRYPSSFLSMDMCTVANTLEEITPVFCKAFKERYAAHRYGKPGCGSTFVLDGNQKNRRDICAATQAGFIEYDGLPGSIISGCQLSPCYRSHYCFYHVPRVMKSSNDECGDKEMMVRYIVGKRTTRKCISYQVAWFGESNQERVTWEPESSLPQSLIDEYESRRVREECVTDLRYGIRSQTIVMGKLEDDLPPANKKSKIEIDKGAFEDAASADSSLACNTEKTRELNEKWKEQQVFLLEFGHVVL